MKQYIKGLISGALISVLIALTCVTFAEDIQVALNTIRINISGIDKVQWDENYTLENGDAVPNSFVYNGTTYLPMRKLDDLYGRTTYWNGDTQTAYSIEPPEKSSYCLIAERPDKNGNVWTYSVCKTMDNKKYLSVKDEKRGYERIYRIAGGGYNTVSMENLYNSCFTYLTEDSIIFTRVLDEKSADSLNTPGGAYLWKIDFENYKDTQDGEQLTGFIDAKGGVGQTVFYGGYLFCSNQFGKIYAYNIETGITATAEVADLGGVGGVEELLVDNFDQKYTTAPTTKPVTLSLKFRDTHGSVQSGEVTFYYDGSVEEMPGLR